MAGLWLRIDTLQVKVAGLWVSVTELRERTARASGLGGLRVRTKGARCPSFTTSMGTDAGRLDISKIRDSDAAEWLSPPASPG